MASRREMLRDQAGVKLVKVTLDGPGGPVESAYVVTARHTPETWSSGNRHEAEERFAAAVAIATGGPKP